MSKGVRKFSKGVREFIRVREFSKGVREFSKWLGS